MAIVESFHLPHAALHLPADDVCFVFLTSEDVDTEELTTRSVQRVKLCESLARSRGAVLLRTEGGASPFDELQRRIQGDQGGSSTSRPFVLPLSQAIDLVSVLESFVRELRAQKATWAEREQSLRRASLLRSLNLLGHAATHTKITEHAVYGLADAFPSMAAYSEACLDGEARQRLAATLAVDCYEQDGVGGRQLVDSLVGFWQEDWPRGPEARG
ncbi:hypothetical protein DRE_05986 [Drechslerella stenobrocha 248]|uniref:Uncharacterized protein n=1 Tax=Drechslerella stenobrocha 248 TaxID=1043628 RepID=W7HQ29_9PEZI|nr:hypothetical protein DRE_05986 [Drechslerella stenobrocha 248]